MKWVFLVFLLIGCTDTDDMRLFQTSLASGAAEPPQPIDVYRFALIGDSIAVGRTDEGDGQPSDLWTGSALSTVLTDNCQYWTNANNLATWKLNMNIEGDNNGGWGIEHRVAHNLVNNNNALKVEMLKYAKGSTGLSANDYWAIGDLGYVNFTTKLTQWGATLNNLYIILPINDCTSDARLDELEIEWQPFLQSFVDNEKILKISVFEMVNATSVTEARLNRGKQIVLDGINAINSPKIVWIANNPDWTFIDNVHPDVPSTDQMGVYGYNNR